MFLKNRCFFYCTNYTLSLIMFTIKVFSFYFRSVARLRYNAHLSTMAPSLCRIFFFTNSILIQSSPLRSTLFCSHVFSSKFFAIHLRKSACNVKLYKAFPREHCSLLIVLCRAKDHIACVADPLNLLYRASANPAESQGHMSAFLIG